LSIIAILSSPIILLSNNNTDITLVNTKAEMDTSSYSSTSGNTTKDISAAVPATKIKFSMYNEPDIGIKFLYPLGWEPVIKRGSDNSTIVEILLPNMTSSNISSGHWHGPATSFIVLSIVDAGSNSSNSDVIAALNSLTKQNLALANQTLPNFRLIALNAITFAGNPAHRIVYSFIEPSIVTPSAFQFQSMNIWTIKGDKVYTISYSQPKEEYPTYLGVVQQMIESFEITR
jgi:hypothetical protein